MIVAKAIPWPVACWWRLPGPLRLVAPLLVMGALWWLSSQQPTPRPPAPWRSFLHNGAHVVAYAALATAWCLVRRWSGLGWPRVAILLTVAYGVVDDLHQAYVPGRVSSVGDVLTDAAGAVTAWCVLRWWLGEPSARRWLPWCLLGCLASVAQATWGPL